MDVKDKQILKIAIPSIISNITVPLLGLIDVSITGHMGSAAYVGAIAIGGMLFNILYWLFVFLRMGTSGLTAQAFGARKLSDVVCILVGALTVAIVISTILLCLQIPIRELSITLISPSKELINLARTYFNICIWGAPPSLLLFVLTGWFLGMQNSRAPMAVAIIQNISNIILSTTFVYGFEMHIEGVALGTVLAQYIGFFAALFLLFSGYLRLYKYLTNAQVYTYDFFKRFFILNKDIFFRTICLIFVHFYFIAAGAKHGDIALAVNALIMQLFLLYSYIMDGFAFAGEALIGKAIGANSKELFHGIIKRLFVWGVIMMLIFTLVYLLFGKSILSLLSNEPSVLLASDEFHIWSLLLPACGMAAFIWDGIFIGATATKGMLFSMVVGIFVFFGLYNVVESSIGNHALWLAFNAYILTRGLVQTIWFKRKTWL